MEKENKQVSVQELAVSNMISSRVNFTKLDRAGTGFFLGSVCTFLPLSIEKYMLLRYAYAGFDDSIGS